MSQPRRQPPGGYPMPHVLDQFRRADSALLQIAAAVQVHAVQTRHFVQ